jgi:hypothetical protein
MIKKILNFIVPKKASKFKIKDLISIKDAQRIIDKRKEIISLESLIMDIRDGFGSKPLVFTRTNNYSSYYDNITKQISPEINKQIIDLIVFGLEEKLSTLAKEINELGVEYERFIK